MKQIFTQNDLIRLVYKETTNVEKAAIEQAISEDWMLKEAYEEIYEAYKGLPKASFSPSTSCLNKILNYSSKSAVVA